MWIRLTSSTSRAAGEPCLWRWTELGDLQRRDGPPQSLMSSSPVLGPPLRPPPNFPNIRLRVASPTKCIEAYLTFRARRTWSRDAPSACLWSFPPLSPSDSGCASNSGTAHPDVSDADTSEEEQRRSGISSGLFTLERSHRRSRVDSWDWNHTSNWVNAVISNPCVDEDDLGWNRRTPFPHKKDSKRFKIHKMIHTSEQHVHRDSCALLVAVILWINRKNYCWISENP